MTERTRQLPPPARRNRDVAGFAVTPGELQTAEDEIVVDLREGAVGAVEAPANGVARVDEETESQTPPAESPSSPRRSSRKPNSSSARKKQSSREKELRRRLIATVTPPIRRLLEERSRETRVSFSDVLIEAWLNHGEALTKEYQPDELIARREKLGVRKPRHQRPPGRSDVQFYLTERELKLIEEGATAAGYEVRSAYIEELLVRELDDAREVIDG